MNTTGLRRLTSGRPRTTGSVLAVAVLALAAAACGSSSKTTSTSTKAKTTTHAAAAKPQPIPGAATKAGAVSPKSAGLKKLVVVPKAAPFAPHIAGIDGMSTAKAIPIIAGDINKFWSQVFSNSGVQFPQTQEVLVQSSPVQVSCSGSTSPLAPTDTPHLCPATGTFYWTVPWMQQNVDTDSGHVNLTFDMALFWSVYLQDLVGSPQQLSSGKLTKAQFAEQNTCLTGVYVHSLASGQLIEKGDTQTANSWVNSLSASAQGIGAPDVTSAQLQSAFATGLKTGDANKCDSGGAAGANK